MKTRLFLAAALLAAVPLIAQNAPKKPAASPPATATGSIGGKHITIEYSSPGVKGREGKIFTPDGRISKDPHYPVWRAGANAATTLKTDGDLTIGDLHVPAGTYTLFADISDPDNWTLIVSKATGEWGLAYDNTKDLGRTKMAMSKPAGMVEDLVWKVNDDRGGTGTISLAWEDHMASVPVSAP